jgi:hypothetical protein
MCCPRRFVIACGPSLKLARNQKDRGVHDRRFSESSSRRIRRDSSTWNSCRSAATQLPIPNHRDSPNNYGHAGNCTESAEQGVCSLLKQSNHSADDENRQPYYPAQRIAAIHAGLGDRAGALKWLEESFRRHEDVLTSVATDPRMDSLRNEPRFQSLLQKMGFTRN